MNKKQSEEENCFAALVYNTKKTDTLTVVKGTS